MAQPDAYSRLYSFTSFQAANPTTVLPADKVDGEYNLIKVTLDQILANLVLIQRDDGRLANLSVGRDQLAADIGLGFGAPSLWATVTSYTANYSTVFEGTGFYTCAISHVSGTFATDLAATKWVLIADFSQATTDAQTAASEAEASATTATTQASTATTQADISTAQAVIATAKAVLTALDAIATAADRVQTGLDRTAAANSAAAAAASEDALDDIYLGPQASDPTLDNDGAALVEGQLYWNSASNVLKVYDGAAWQSYSPSSGMTNLVDDTAPSLGGDLALNGHVITGLVIGTNVQAYDAALTSIAALGTAGDKGIYFTAANVAAEFDLTAAGRALLDDAAASDQRTTLGLAIGTDVQAPATTLAGYGVTDALKQGKLTIGMPAIAMYTRTTNGAATGSIEKATNKNMFKTFDFDTTTQEFVQFEVPMPKNWNLGTVTFVPIWSHPATTTNFGVAFGLAGVGRRDDDAGDVAFGTAVTSVDTGGTTDDIYVGPESAAITIAGTLAAGCTVQFQINRTVADAGDTLAVDARLHGIRLFYTVNAADDT